MGLFDSSSKNTFIGIVLVIVAVVFLLSGLDILRVGALASGQYLVSAQVDTIIAFVLIAVGLGYIYSEAGKGK